MGEEEVICFVFFWMEEGAEEEVEWEEGGEG